MATLPTIFIESILDSAKAHNIKIRTLPEDKGLLLFAQEIPASEQCALLKEMIAELDEAQVPGPDCDDHTENCQNTEQSTIDCQVTVEERAQLFKLLNG